MASLNRIPGDLQLGGHLTVGSLDLPANTVSDSSVKTNAAIQRSKLAQLDGQSCSEQEELDVLRALIEQKRQRQGISTPTEG